MPSFSTPNSNVLPENLWVSAEFLLLSTGPTLDGTLSRGALSELVKALGILSLITHIVVNIPSNSSE